MRASIHLRAADLHYPNDLQVYTAVSGPIDSLSARYLEIERSDGFHGVGEVRANITYLSQLPEAAVDPAIRELCCSLPWSAEPEAILGTLSENGSHAPPIATAAIENAVLDGIARLQGITIAQILGGSWRPSVQTNQCLFWSPDETFERLADRFLREGFRQLKMRIGVGPFDADLRRLQRLRDRAGPDVSIAVDANGVWTADEAIEHLRALEPFGLSYVEQPTYPGDWEAFKRAVENTSIPLMADEGLKGDGDVSALCEIGSAALAHLKIVKLGGPLPVARAMRRFREAGVGVMIGQMNEGAMATAIAAHCAMALTPEYAELYGCYGLLDDPTSGVTYLNGEIHVPWGPGLGVTFDAARCRTVWVEQLG